MNNEINTNNILYFSLSTLIVIINGIFIILNFTEFYFVRILNKVDGYPFGTEGTLPYFYKTAELYSMVCLIWGIVFFLPILITIRISINNNRRNLFWILCISVFLILGQFWHSQIGVE